MSDEKWVVLYSRNQNAYHVETLGEYENKGEGHGGYRIVAMVDSREDALRVGQERRAKRWDG